MPPILRAPLSGRSLALARRIEAASRAGDAREAEALWVELSLLAPGHAETHRLLGELRMSTADFGRAIEALETAIASGGVGAGILARLAEAQMLDGRTADAAVSLDAAVEAAGTDEEWLVVGLACDRHGRPRQALHCADRMLESRPPPPEAALLRARSLQVLGEPEAAARTYRELIARNGSTARAWFGLAEIKTSRFDRAETETLERLARQPGLAEAERALLAFALGKALEDAGRYAEAKVAFDLANGLCRSVERWHAPRFSSQVDSLVAGFPVATPSAEAQADAAVVFIVGMPRSCTTLIEQILSAHPDVSAGGELPYLERIVERESRRRGKPLERWCREATPSDWRRLGDQYLACTRALRANRSLLTDKAPGNWLLAGAALAMLPGARVIHARRDPLESIWSCYKQRFGEGRAPFAYDLDTLAAYWFDSERLGGHLSRRLPERYRFISQDDLAAQPEATIRQLLLFSGVGFDPRCLQPHESNRPVWTPSAAQVRQPIHADARRAAAYGELLAPLRQRIEDYRARLGELEVADSPAPREPPCSARA